MVIDEKTLALIIGSSVATYPKEITSMLVKNKVLPSTNTAFSNEQMVDGILIGLNSSESFRNEYSSWIEQIITTLN